MVLPHNPLAGVLSKKVAVAATCWTERVSSAGMAIGLRWGLACVEVSLDSLPAVLDTGAD